MRTQRTPALADDLLDQEAIRGHVPAHLLVVPCLKASIVERPGPRPGPVNILSQMPADGITSENCIRGLSTVAHLGCVVQGQYQRLGTRTHR